MAYADTTVLLATVRTPRRRSRTAGINIRLNAIVRMVSATPKPQRRMRIARRAEGAAEHEEHHHADESHEHGSEKRQRLGMNRGLGVHQIEQRRCGHPSDGAQQNGKAGRSQKRLIDDAIDLVGLVGARKPRHQHAHSREYRHGEDDDDDDDLPADTDRRVCRVAHEMTDHGVVDDALQPGDDVLQHRRPRQPPDSRTNRTFDDRAIKSSSGRRGTGH